MRTTHKAALAATGLLATLFVPTVQARATPTTTPGTAVTASTPPDHPATLARYYDQHPTWQRCGPSSAHYPAGFRCATITVPLDYARPSGPTLRLKISRLRTAVPGKRHGVLLTNPGGPGSPGLSYPAGLKEQFPKSVTDRYDLVGFDPRGLGASTPLRCGLTEREVEWPRAYRAAAFAEDTALARRFASKCTARQGARLPYLNTRNTARDMDVIRGVLGERKISYVGWSYGTYLGAVGTGAG
ncbi:alpha/beta fold hydrolase [Streptomyces cyaneus]|uniref:alpha/beta fold hydrolase n=1 Tax=Streptomyces cyaneus TaxID=1904 RepID=UPI001FE4D320|nr:alpha/beta fold hydrolase [Streptomyces cyaneus]